MPAPFREHETYTYAFCVVAGDISHLASILLLLQKIQSTRSCRGLSFKTQALYATVFVARYLDLVYRWVSVYNFVMKIFFIASSVYILYLMKMKFRCVLSACAFPATSVHTRFLEVDPRTNADQHTTPQSTRSASNTSSHQVPYSPSSSTIASPPPRYCGLFQFSSRGSSRPHLSSSPLPSPLACSPFLPLLPFSP